MGDIILLDFHHCEAKGFKNTHTRHVKSRTRHRRIQQAEYMMIDYASTRSRNGWNVCGRRWPRRKRGWFETGGGFFFPEFFVLRRRRLSGLSPKKEVLLLLVLLLLLLLLSNNSNRNIARFSSIVLFSLLIHASFQRLHVHLIFRDDVDCPSPSAQTISPASAQQTLTNDLKQRLRS